MPSKDLDITISALVQLFKDHANPQKASEMGKYMKGNFQYLGISKPLREALEQPFLNEGKKLSYAELEYLVREMWKQPEREFQYFAIWLMRGAKIWKENSFISLADYLLSNKSWWDSVDMIAIQLVGPHFLLFPENKKSRLSTWQKSSNMWLNRTAIIFSLKYKTKTDIPALFDIILPFSNSEEFFIQKAIGWALRELSYYFPNEVVEFCENHKLKPLSRREALRVIKKKNLA